MPERQHRQLAAILFTDMAGYTALMAKDEILASHLRVRHREVLRHSHETHQGEILQYFGDGTLSIFHSAMEAVKCAIDIQHALQKEPQVPLRIGIHSGEIVWDNEGIYGSSVNIASRLESFAEIGSILISAKIQEELSNQKDLKFQSLGFFELKNLPKAIEIFAVANDGIVVPKVLSMEGKGKRLESKMFKSTARLENFVGREIELKQLHNVWKDVQTGKGGIIGIAGEPGIGKTSLTEDFLQQINQGGEPCFIARGRCSERLAGTEAYLPFLEVLEGLMQEEQNAILLKQVAPAWYVQLLPHSVEESKSLELATQATQERRKRELAHFLEQVSLGRPLLIFFDDLHWLDNSSVDLLAYLALRLPELPVLIIVTYRPADMIQVDHPFLHQKLEWQSKRLYREIDLGFLSVENISDYLDLEFSRNLFPRDFSTSIWDRTEGNSLFMVDLIRHFQAKKVIDCIEGQWQLTQLVSVIDAELPESIEGMIDRKMKQLSKEEERLLQVAAVQGYVFDTAVLGTQFSISPWKVEEKLEDLSQKSRLINRTQVLELTEGTVSLQYRFVHVLYQNALFNSLTPGKRAYLCGQVAESLLKLHSDKTTDISAELAMLFKEARNWKKATHFYLLATQRAARKFAYKETIALGEKGLSVLKFLPENAKNLQWEIDFLLATGPAKSMVYGWGNEEVIRNHERCYALSKLLDDASTLFPVYNGLFMNYSFRGNLADAKKIAQEALAIALQKKDVESLPYVYSQYGSILEWMGEIYQALPHFEKGLLLYKPEVHRQLISKYAYDSKENCLAHSGWILGLIGFPEKGLTQAQTALDWAEQLGHPSSLSEALTFLAWVYKNQRSYSASERYAVSLLKLSVEHGFPFRIMVAKCLLGSALANRGKIKEGISEITSGLNVVKGLDTNFLLTLQFGLLAEAYLLNKNKKEGLEAVDEGLNIVMQTGERVHAEELYRLKGELSLLGKGDETEAEKYYQKSIDLTRENQTKWRELRSTVSLARLWRRQGKHQKAYEKLKTIYDWFTEGFDTLDLKEAKALLNELQG